MAKINLDFVERGSGHDLGETHSLPSKKNKRIL
jgi:hypothetical protein